MKKILFHPEFSKGITAFLNMIDLVTDKVKAIKGLAKHLDLFERDPFSYYSFFQGYGFEDLLLNSLHASLHGYDRFLKIFCEISEDKINNPNFMTIAGSLMTKDMNVYDRGQVIQALGNVDSCKWDRFVEIAKTLTMDMKGSYRAQVIEVLGKVVPEKWEEFVSKVNALTNGMTGDDRALVIATLGRVAPANWDKFIEIADSLTKDMDGKERAKVLAILGAVQENERKEHVYNQIQLLMQQTRGKIKLTLADAVKKLVYQLEYLRSKHATVFTTILIQSINEAPEILDDNQFRQYVLRADSKLSMLPRYEIENLLHSPVPSAQSSVERQNNDILRPIPAHTPTKDGLNWTTSAGSSDGQEDVTESSPELRRGRATPSAVARQSPVSLPKKKRNGNRRKKAVARHRGLGALSSAGEERNWEGRP